MAVSLFECCVDSIPINSLMPIKGTPLENLERISEPDILRTVALFRYCLLYTYYDCQYKCICDWREDG